jgi:hypothetical protein
VQAMAARRRTGLDAEAVDSLRTRLAEGKRPRVQFSGTQFPDGTTGSVVRIGEESTDGADFITVRMSVNGVTDELAFAPNELRLPGRKLASAPARAAKRPARKAATPSSPPAKAAAPSDPPAKAVVPIRPPAKTAEPTKPASPSQRRKSAPPPKITVTLTSDAATWSVTASRGARSVAKSLPVSPGVVTAIAELLDNAAVIEAVAEVNQTALAEAEDRAARLREELAQLDAVLAAHRVPR